MSQEFRKQDYRNLLVELAFRWAHIEQDVRVSDRRLALALEKALRVEAIFDHYDAGSGLPLGDAEDIMGPDWESPEVDVVGMYIVVFDKQDWDAAEMVRSDRELGGALARYEPPGYIGYPGVLVKIEGLGLPIQGEVCRRPSAVSTPKPPDAPRVKRGKHWMTPIEAQFYDELKETGLTFAAQVPIEGPGKDYRPDFVVYYVGGALAVELDGHESHKTREQRQRDAEKDRWLQLHGFRTARWTGSDVHRDARACVSELRELVRQFETKS